MKTNETIKISSQSGFGKAAAGYDRIEAIDNRTANNEAFPYSETGFVRCCSEIEAVCVAQKEGKGCKGVMWDTFDDIGRPIIRYGAAAPRFYKAIEELRKSGQDRYEMFYLTLHYDRNGKPFVTKSSKAV